MPDSHQLTARKMMTENPEVWTTFQDFATACAKEGPLGGRVQVLVGLAVAAGNASKGTLQFQVRRALKQEVSADEIRHVAMLAAPIIGFGNAITVLGWIDEALE